MPLETRVAALSRRLPDFRGKTGLAFALRRFKPPATEAFHVTTRQGDRLVLPAGSIMGWQTAFSGEWDAVLIDHVRQYLQPGTIAFDIGAAIGLWTVPLAKAARQAGGSVVAVEPLPGNAKWLADNLALNGLNDVTVHHIALGSGSGTLRIESGEEGGGSAAISISGQGTEIPVATLDDLPVASRIGFIKMDVEGFELEVLRGASRVLQRDRPVVFGEFSRDWLSMRNQDPDPVLRRLHDAGYAVNAVDVERSRPWRTRDRVVLRPLAPPFSHFDSDLLLIPR